MDGSKFPEALTKGSIGGHAVQIAVTSTLFLPYAANRISAIFSIPSGNNIVISGDPNVTWANGLGALLAGANTVIQLNRYDHGVLLRGPVYAAAALAVGIYVLEVFADAP